MRVIPPRSRRAGRKAVANVAARRNHRRPLFHRPIVPRIDRQPMPVHNIFLRTGICNIDGDGYSLAQPQQRPRHLTVVARRLDVDPRRNLDLARLDAQCVIGRRGSESRERGPLRPTARPRHMRCQHRARRRKKVPAIEGHHRAGRPTIGKMSYGFSNCPMYASARLYPLCRPRKWATVSCTSQ